MTAYDAFAIAFDEISDEEKVVMDRKSSGNGVPSYQQPKKNNTFGATGSAATGGGMGGMGGGMGGMGGGMGGMGGSAGGSKDSQSLAAHMQQYHPNGFNPATDHCKFYDALKKNLQNQGMSEEDAAKKALEAHNSSGYAIGEGGGGEPVSEEEGKQLANQMLQQLKAKPSIFAIESLARQSRLIQPPLTMTSTDGKQYQVQDTFQLACAMFVQEEKENSDDEVVQNAAEKAENAISQVMGTEETGTLKGPPTESEVKWPPLHSSDFSYQREITPEESAILAAHPERREQLQNVVELEAKLQSASEHEQGDLQQQIEALKIIFQGKDNKQPPEAEATEQPQTAQQAYEEAQKAFNDAYERQTKANEKFQAAKSLEEAKAAKKELEEAGATMFAAQDAVNKAKENLEREQKGQENAPKEKPEGTVSPAGEPKPEAEPEKPTGAPNPSEQPAEKPAEPTETVETYKEEQEEEPAPSDEQFRIKGGKYRVGDVTYTDVSKMGTLHGMIASFLAGMKGEGIITSWDRISGTWDAIKRSESGENVRDGIKQALSDLGIREYADRVTNPVAKGKLDVITEMFQNAKTPAQKMAAYNAFEKWKDKYGEETGLNSSNSTMTSSMESVHSDGKVLGSLQRINNKGGIEDISETEKIDNPSTDILGEPGFLKSDGTISWSPEAKIENLDQKKETIESAMGKLKNPIFGKEAGHTTSHNSTFIRYDLMDRITKKQKDELVKQLAFDLGCEENEVSIAVDSKNKQLVVGIKNDVAADLATRDIMNSDEWKKACKTMRCPIILGRDNQGNAVIRDLKDLTHLLIAGDTGKGKSVGMNTILCSMMMAKKPSQLKTVLIDLKKVELSRYKNSKFNAVPVATDIDSALRSLEFVRQEMENREALLEQAGVANIDEYNAKARAEGKEELPTMVLGIDELTELKKAGGAQVYDMLTSIGNKARASGIHLLCATQKPTKENIGEVKSAFTSRLAFPIKAPEGSEAIFSKGDYRANTLSGNGSFILDVDGKETRGKGSAMAHDDPQRVVGYWNGEKIGEGSGDASGASGVESTTMKSGYKKVAPPAGSPEIQSVIVDSNGNRVGAIHVDGSRIDFTKNGKRLEDGQVAPWEEEVVETTSDKLPQSHIDQIKSAVEQGKTVTMGASEGFFDSFKWAFPSDWTVEEVKGDDGETVWKASPPTTNTGSPHNTEEGKEESAQSGTEVGGEQETAKKIEKLSDLDQSFNPSDAQSMIAYRDRLKDAIKQLSNVTVHGKKEADALARKLAPFRDELEWLEGEIRQNHPDADIQEGDNIGEGGDVGGSEGETAIGGSPKPESKQKMSFVESRFNRRKKELQKAQDQEEDDEKASKIDDEIAALTQRYEAAKAKYESGGSPDEVLQAFTGTKAQETQTGENETSMSGDNATETGHEEQTAGLEGLPTLKEGYTWKQHDGYPTIFDSKGEVVGVLNGGKMYKVTGRNADGKYHAIPVESSEVSPWDSDEDAAVKRKGLTPKPSRPTSGYQALSDKQIKTVKDLIPKDWEIETDNELGRPAEHESGRVFVRNPTNGSYGYVELKGRRKNGSIGPVWTKEVLTTDDKFEGETRDEKGRIKIGKNAQAARDANNRVLKLESVAAKNGTSLAEEIVKYADSPQYKGDIPDDLLQRARDGEEIDWEKESNRLNTLEKHYRTGLDQAPYNMTIVANAVAEAISKIK